MVVQTAPSVRVAIGEELGLQPGAITTGQLVSGLKALGFDHVFDTGGAGGAGGDYDRLGRRGGGGRGARAGRRGWRTPGIDSALGRPHPTPPHDTPPRRPPPP
jgi:hypothetical protein